MNKREVTYRWTQPIHKMIGGKDDIVRHKLIHSGHRVTSTNEGMTIPTNWLRVKGVVD